MLVSFVSAENTCRVDNVIAAVEADSHNINHIKAAQLQPLQRWMDRCCKTYLQRTIDGDWTKCTCRSTNYSYSKWNVCVATGWALSRSASPFSMASIFYEIHFFDISLINKLRCVVCIALDYIGTGILQLSHESLACSHCFQCTSLCMAIKPGFYGDCFRLN